MLDAVHEEMLYGLAAALFFATFLICYFINLATVWQRFPIVRTGLLCFGGGTLLETSFLHLLPKAQYNLPNAALPMFCLSFFILYISDEVFYFCYNAYSWSDTICKFCKKRTYQPLEVEYDEGSFDSASLESLENDERITARDDEAPSHQIKLPIEEEEELEQDNLSPNKTSALLSGDNSHNYGSTDHTNIPNNPTKADQFSVMFDFRIQNPQPCSSKTDPLIPMYTNITPKLSRPKSTPTFPVTPPVEQPRRRISQHQYPTCDAGYRRTAPPEEYNEVTGIHVNVHQDNDAQQLGVGLVGLLLAICIHTVLGGIAIGLDTTKSELLCLTGLTSFHKFMLAVCLAMELTNKRKGKICFFIHILIYSTASSVGIIAGAMIRKYELTADACIMPLMQSLAGGFLHYVSLCKIVAREKRIWKQEEAKSCAGIVQIAAFGAGFCLMYLLDIFIVPGLPEPPDLTIVL